MTATTDPLAVDAYEGDQINPASWRTYFAAGYPWCGAIMKACQGLTYVTPNFADQWNGIRAGAGPRYGVDAFRGAYDYWSSKVDDRAQARAYLAIIEKAGGWGAGDLWPIIDVEAGGGNQGVTKVRVVDGVSAWADEVLKHTGRRPMLYGGSLLRDLKIVEPLGCQVAWVACYGPSLPPHIYTDIGRTLADTWGWQYREAGGKTTPPPGYPQTCPIGDLDTTAMIINGGADPRVVLQWTRDHLGTQAR